VTGVRRGIPGRRIRSGLRAEAVPLVLVAVLVFAASVTAAAAPGRLTALADRALRQNVGAASFDDRSLTFDATVTDTAASGVAFSDMQDALGGRLTPPLAKVLTGVSHTYRAFDVPTVGTTIWMPGGVPDRMVLVDDSRSAHLIRYVAGVAPENASSQALLSDPGHQIAIGVSSQASAVLHLPVGAVVQFGGPAAGPDGTPRPPETGVVSGLFEAAGPAAGLGPDDSAFFSQNDTLLTPRIAVTSGIKPLSYWSGAFLVSDAGLAGVVHAGGGVQIQARWRRTADTAALTVAGTGQLGRDLQRLEQSGVEDLCKPAALQHTSCEGLGGPVGGQHITDGLTALFALFHGRLLAAAALESFGIAALLAVELASVFAAARLMAARRTATVILQRARGASLRQAAAPLVAESVLVIVPVTVLGRLVGGSGQLWPSLLVAVFAVAAIPTTVLVTAELAAVSGDRRRGGGVAVLPKAKRRTAEGVIAALAIAGVVSLRSRGVAGTVAEGSLDPVLATVPVLLGMLIAVLAVKAVPPPTTGAVRLVGRGRSAAVWLGLASAAERGQTRAVALTVLVLTLAGAVFGGVVVKTLDRGQAAAADRLGADAVVHAPTLTADVLNRLKSMPGVRMEPVMAFDRSTVDDDGGQHVIRFVGVGPALVPGLPAGTDPDGSVPVLASPAAARNFPDGTFTVSLLAKDVDFRISGTLPAVPGGPVRAALEDPSVAYVVLPAAELSADAGVSTPTAAALYGPVSSARIRAVLAGVAPYTTQIEVRSEQLAAMRSDGLSRSLAGVFEVCTGLSAAFAVLVVMLELAGTARERGRTVSFLRTMGLPSRSAAVITAVQLVPTAMAAALSGALLGAALPWLLGPALDMTAFTDGYPPPIRVDMTSTALLGLALLAVVAIAAAAEMVLSRRRRVSEVLRLGGE
jgi:putative ABC transport system permease protein